jgi:hypothetical protein
VRSCVGLLLGLAATAGACGGEQLGNESDAARRTDSAASADNVEAGAFGLCPVVPPSGGGCGVASRVDCLYVVGGSSGDGASLSGSHWTCLDGGWQYSGPAVPCAQWLCEEFVQCSNVERSFAACIVDGGQECCACDEDASVGGTLTKCGPC